MDITYFATTSYRVVFLATTGLLLVEAVGVSLKYEWYLNASQDLIFLGGLMSFQNLTHS